MSTRSHDRAPDKTAFSIAMPIRLREELEQIAAAEHRTRNGQIVHFLAEAAERYMVEHPETFRKAALYAIPEPDLEQDIAAEPPPAPYGVKAQQQAQQQSQQQRKK